LLSLARADWILRALSAAGDRVLVLNFHRVSPEPNPFWPPMTPEAFADLAGYLASRCRVLTFGELADAQTDRRPTIILSFDDGYRDFVEYAMPILALIWVVGIVLFFC
jgi:peptidoglycan/xylan/chitin deacetylase (PgdA/CDA1 family)